MVWSLVGCSIGFVMGCIVMRIRWVQANRVLHQELDKLLGIFNKSREERRLDA